MNYSWTGTSDFINLKESKDKLQKKKLLKMHLTSECVNKFLIFAEEAEAGIKEAEHWQKVKWSKNTAQKVK